MLLDDLVSGTVPIGYGQRVASLWYDGRRYPLAEQHVAAVRQQVLDSAATGQAFWLDIYGPQAPEPTWLLIGSGAPLALHDWDDRKTWP